MKFIVVKAVHVTTKKCILPLGTKVLHDYCPVSKA